MKVLKERKWVYLGLTILVAVVILALIAMLQKIDVDWVGESTMTIGFAKVNKGIYNALGESQLFNILSTVILIIAFVGAVFFVCLGAYQLVKRKKLESIDNSIKSLVLTYALVGWVYVFFDFIFVVNQRPTTGVFPTSPSFPSTHTMIIVSIVLTGITMAEGLIKNKKILFSVEGAAGLLGVLGIVFRMLSGKHWFTDIIAGILFGIMFYFFHKWVTLALNDYDEAHKKVEENENIASEN